MKTLFSMRSFAFTALSAVALFFCLGAGSAQAGLTKYWIGSSGGSFSSDSNWSTSSGGANNTTHPIAGDTATFDSGGDTNCALDSTAAATAINMKATYSHTITQTANLTITGGFTQSAGTWTSTSGTTTFADGGGSAISVVSTLSFYNLTIIKSSFVNVNLSSGTLNVLNNFTASGDAYGTIDGGTIILNNGGTITGAFGGGTATLRVDAGTLTLAASATQSVPKINLNGGNLSMSGSSAVTINTLTVGSGTFTMGTNSTTITNTLAQSGGTITLASNNTNTFTVTSTSSLTGGTLDLGTSSALRTFTATTTVNGGTIDGRNYTGTLTESATLTLTAGTFKANETAGGMTTSIKQNFTVGAAFSFDNGTTSDSNRRMNLTFVDNGGSSVNLNSATLSFYNLTITKSSFVNVNLSSGIINVLNTFTASGSDIYGTIDTGTIILNNGGSITGGFGGGSAILRVDAGTLTLDASSAALITPKINLNGGNATISSGGSSAVTVNTLTVGNSSSTFTGSSNHALTVTNATAVTAGTLNINGGNYTASGGVTISSGATLQLLGGETATTPTLNSGSIVKYSGTAASYTTKNWSYSNLTIAGGATSAFAEGTNTTIGNNLTITTGIYSLAGYNLTVTGTFSNDGTLRLQGGETTVSLTMDTDSGTVEYVGSGATTYSSLKLGNTYYNLSFNNATGSWTHTSTLAINGDLNITAGTLVSGANLNFKGNWTNAGTYTSATYIAAATGTGAQTIIAGSSSFYGFKINKASGTATLSTNSLTVTSTLTLQAGTLDANGQAMSVAGNWTNSGGTFTASSNTVTLSGTSQTISGSNTFYNLTKSVSAADTLTFTAGTTQTVTGTLTMNGASGQLLTIASSAASAATLTPTNTTASYLSLSYSTNSGTGAATHCWTGCTDGGNNSGWSFAAPAVNLSSTTATATEGGATGSYTVVLNAAPSATVTVTPASSDTSYGVTVSGALTFTTGNWSTPQTVTVTAVDDTRYEGSHTATVSHSASSADTNYNGISISSVTTTITDNDSQPTMSIDSPSVTEGNSGTATLTYTVTLNHSSSQTITASYATSNGTATAGSDYTATSGTVTFTAGVTSQTINVTVSGDYVAEADETVIMTLSSPSNATISSATGTGTITNDDTAGVTITESGGITNVTEGGATDSYTVVLTSQPTASVTVTPTSSDTTYGVTVSGALTFTTGNWSTPQTVTVTAVNDTLYEGAHTATITHAASGGGYNSVSIASVTAHITDNDHPPVLAAPGDQSGNENALITFTLSATDADGDTMSYSCTSNCPSGLSVNSSTGVVSWTPDYSQAGTYTSVTFQASDGTNTNTQAITITVTDTQGSLSSTNVEPATLVAGATGTATVSFTTANSIPITGKIVVTFPSGYDVSAASGATCSSMDGSFATAVSGQIVTITRSAGSIQAAAAETCTIDNIKNPRVSGSTGTYTIQTTDSSGDAIDTGSSVTADTITAGALTSTNVQPATLVAGATGTATITFTNTNPVPLNGKIKVTFPSGYDVSAAASATCSSMDGSFATAVSGQIVTITRSAGTSQNAAAQTCTVASIRNPQVSGSTGTYSIQTTNNAAAVIDQDTAVTADTITPGALTSTNVEPATLVDGATGTATISFTNTNPIPLDGKVKVTFPSGYDVSSAASATCSSMDGSFATAVSGQIVTITRSAGSSQTAAAQTCTIASIKNPVVSGSTSTYGLQTTNSADAVIDQDTGVTADTITVAALTSSNVEPATLVAGATGTATISFTNVNPVPLNGKIKVTFPAGYDVSAAASATCSSMDGSFATAVSGQIVTITRSAGTSQTAAAQTCTIGSIKNPVVSGSTGTYSIQTTNSSDAVIDQDTAVTADTITAAALTSTNVEPASLIVGVDGNIVISFTTANPWPADGKLLIDLPDGFNADSAALVSENITGSFNTPISITSVGGTNDVITLTRDGLGSSTPASTSVSITISSVRNPVTTGSTGTYSLKTQNSAGTTIDQDTAVSADTIALPSVQWTAASQASASESGTMTVTAQLSAVSGLDTTVPYTVTGTATGGGTDYTITASPITINAGDTTATATITIVADTTDEPDETVILTIGSPTNATVGGTNVHTATITDDDAAPSLSMDDPSVTEGNSGTATLTFTATLSAASGKTVTVDYATSNGTATAGSDYTATSGTLTFNPGQTSKTIDVTVSGDHLVEADETLTMTLSNPGNATISDATGTGIIINDDNRPSLTSPGAKSVAENATLSFSLSATDADVGDTLSYSCISSCPTGLSVNSSTGAVSWTPTYSQAGVYNSVTFQASDGTNTDTQAITITVTDTESSLTSTNVQPASLVAGYNGTVTVSFTTANPIPVDGKIKVTFPAGFDLSLVVGADGACSTMDGTFVTTVSGQVVTITRQADGTIQTAAAESCTIAHVRNPQVSGSAGTYTIQTTDSSGSAIDTDSSVTADVITPGALNATTSVVPATLVAGDSGTATINFFTSNPIPTTGKVKVTFPVNFDVSAASGAACSTMDGSITTSVSGQIVTLTRSGAGRSIQSADQETCTIDHIKNPEISGSTGAYDIKTTNTSDAIIDEESGVPADVILVADLSSTDVAPATLIAGATGTATITFTTVNSIALDGKIKVTFPAGFNVAAASSAACSSMDGSFATSVSGQIVTITRSAGSSRSAAAQTCTIANITNPGISGSTGTYSIQTTNASDAVSDQDLLVTADVITAGALTATNVQPASLIVGVDGNLDINFTTANPWPADGKLVLDLPAGFNADSAAVVSTTNVTGSFTLALSDGDGTKDIITFTRTGAGAAVISSGTAVEILISSVRNPTSNGSTGTYSLTTEDNSGTLIDQKTDVSADTISLPILSIDSPSVTEGNSGTSTMTFTVSLSAVSGVTTTVDYATSNVTATAGSDYVATSGSLSFAAGETSKTIAVTVNGDTTYEADETLRVTLSNPGNATIAAPSYGTGTITNDDSTPTLSINDVTQAEGNSGTSTFTFTVTLSSTSSYTTTVDYATSNLTATAGSDYTATSGTLTFNPGQTSKTIAVTVSGDSTDEPDETFRVTLSNPTNATISGSGYGTGTITNDDSSPSLSINDVSQAEGNSGTSTMTFTVTLSAVSGKTVSVNYATANNTATAGSDYVSTSGTLTFNPGVTTQTLNVTINGDTTIEPDETFYVNLSGATNASISDNQGLGNIIADDHAPVFTGIGNQTVKRGSSLSAILTASDVDAGDTLTYTCASNCPTGLTVNSSSGAVAWTPIASQKGAFAAVTFQVADTAGHTDTQAITITVTGVTIVESGGSVDVTEGATTDTYTVVLDSQPTADVTITLGPDAQVSTAPSSPLTFTSVNWATPQTVTVTAVDDHAIEGPHTGTITHTVSSSGGGGDATYDGITAASVIANITDNDTPGVNITESGGSTQVTEGGTSDSYNLVLTSQPTADVVVTVTSSDSTYGIKVNKLGDSPTASTTLTFTSATWNIAQPITVTAVDDPRREGTQTKTITHTASSSDTNYNGISISDLSVQVADNDSAGVTISKNSVTVSEDGSLDTYTVILNSEPTAAVAVTVTASSPVLLVGPNSSAPESIATLNFDNSNWSVAQTVQVSVAHDHIQEGSRTRSITHSSASVDTNYNSLTINTVTATVADVDLAGITQSETSLTVTEGATRTYTVVLDSEPSADVVITPTVSTGLSIAPPSLTFTASNWNVPQTFTLTAINDDIVTGDRTGSISHHITTTDSNYSARTLSDIAVTILEDDVVSTLSVSLGDDQTIHTGADHALTATLTPSSATVTYLWSIVSGGGTLSSTSAASVTYTAGSSSGTTVIRVTVNDTAGHTASDDISISVAGDDSVSHEELRDHIVGISAGGTTVVERREGDSSTGHVSLEMGHSTVSLPSEASEESGYVMAFVGCHLAVGVPSAGGGSGSVYFSTRCISDLGDSVDLGSSVRESLSSSHSLTRSLNTQTLGDGFAVSSGPQANGGFGSFISVGDVNGDGEEEIFVGAPQTGLYGVIYVYNSSYQLIATIFGSEAHRVSATLVAQYLHGDYGDMFLGPNNLSLNMNLMRPSQIQAVDSGAFVAGSSDFGGNIDLGTQDTDALLGDLSALTSSSSPSGYVTSTFADINGDSVADLILVDNLGGISIFYGPVAQGASLRASDANIHISGAESNIGFGEAIAVGDVSGDGNLDLIIGAPRYGTDKGGVCIVFGPINSDIDISTSSKVLWVYGETADALGADFILAARSGSSTKDIYTLKGTNNITYKLSLNISTTASTPTSTPTSPSDPVLAGSGASCSLHAEAVNLEQAWMQICLVFLSAFILYGFRKRIST